MTRHENGRISVRQADEIARIHSSGRCRVEAQGSKVHLFRNDDAEPFELHSRFDLTEKGILAVINWVLDD